MGNAFEAACSGPPRRTATEHLRAFSSLGKCEQQLSIAVLRLSDTVEALCEACTNMKMSESEGQDAAEIIVNAREIRKASEANIILGPALEALFDHCDVNHSGFVTTSEMDAFLSGYALWVRSSEGKDTHFDAYCAKICSVAAKMNFTADNKGYRKKGWEAAVREKLARPGPKFKISAREVVERSCDQRSRSIKQNTSKHRPISMGRKFLEAIKGVSVGDSVFCSAASSKRTAGRVIADIGNDSFKIAFDDVTVIAEWSQIILDNRATLKVSKSEWTNRAPKAWCRVMGYTLNNAPLSDCLTSAEHGELNKVEAAATEPQVMLDNWRTLPF